MSATQELIAAALTVAGAVRWQYPEISDELREACARAMVQPAAPDMAEVERLTNTFAEDVFHHRDSDAITSYSALLDYVHGVIAERDALIAAHAGATKKMARDERQLFESWIVRECGPGETKRWLNTEVYENMRVNDYRTGWVTCLGLMSAAPQPVSAAEVPMPEPAAYLSDNGLWCNEPLALRDEPAFFSGEVQQYGDAREAAGYARGLKEVNTALNDVFSAADGLSSAIDAALRGEMKPAESTNQQQGEAK